LAEIAPGWLGPRIQPGWQDRYTRRIDLSRLPAGDPAPDRWAAQAASDGGLLLAAIGADPEGVWLSNLPRVKALAQVWEQQCAQGPDGQWRFRTNRLIQGCERIDSPHDIQARWSSKRSTTYTATVGKSRILANKHIIPELGARKLRELSADDVDEWLLRKAQEVSTRTLQELRSILKRTVARAQARDKVKRNVVLLCEIPEGRPGRPSKPSRSTRPRPCSTPPRARTPGYAPTSCFRC
jgi:hypothetical protein